MRVFVLVVCCLGGKNGDYDLLSDAIKNTWGKTQTEDARVFYLWCNNYFRKDFNDFVLDKEEGYGMILRKMLAFFFKHRHEDFDYIYKVNVGSYIHLGNLLEFLKDCPREKFYASHAVGKFDDIPFCSGSGFFLSRDLVMLSLAKIKMFGHDHIEDVSYGRFMMNNGVSPIKTDITGKKKFFWKLRHGDGQRNLDRDKMYELYQKINEQ